MDELPERVMPLAGSRRMSPGIPLWLLGFAIAWVPSFRYHSVTECVGWAACISMFFIVLAGAVRPRVCPSAGRVVLATIVTAAMAGGLFRADCGRYYNHVCDTPIMEFLGAALVGGGLGLPLLLPILIVYRPASLVGRARFGSPCDRADRRSVWFWLLAEAQAMLSVPLFDTLDSWSGHGYHLDMREWQNGQLPIMIIMIIMELVLFFPLGFILVRDYQELRRVRRAAEGIDGGAAVWSEANLHEQRTADFLDLGVGEQRWVEVDEARDPYRGTSNRRVRMAGDPEMAIRQLGRATLRNAVPFTVALAIMCWLFYVIWLFSEL